MDRTRRAALALVVAGVAMLLASGIALAVTKTCVVSVLCEGTNNADTITGTDEADDIRAKDGPDTVSGLAGGDNIVGGNGADKLYAIDANQTPTTGGGNDKITGGNGDDTILAANGDDELDGGDDNDYIDGDQGRDIIVGGTHGDEIYGGEHDDDQGGALMASRGRIGGLYGGLGQDTIDGGPGDDRIVAGPVDEGAQDTVYGGSEDDLIDVANKPAAKDIVYCGGGHDRVTTDSLDSVADDCEDAKTYTQRAQEFRENQAKIDQAADAFERHMSVGSDGELKLDKAGLDQETVDPGARGLLETSLDHTNGRIKAGEITASEVFPRANALLNPFPWQPSSAQGGASAQSGEFGVMTVSGYSGTVTDWTGTTFYLNSEDTGDLLGGLAAGTGIGGILTALGCGPICGVPAGIAGVSAGVVISQNEGEGVAIFMPSVEYALSDEYAGADGWAWPGFISVYPNPYDAEGNPL